MAHVDDNLFMSSVQGDMPSYFPAPNNTSTVNYRPTLQRVQNAVAINESRSTVTSSDDCSQQIFCFNQNKAQALELTSISPFRPVPGTGHFSSSNSQATYNNQENHNLQGSNYANKLWDYIVPELVVLYQESANNLWRSPTEANHASLPQQTLQIRNRSPFAEFEGACWCEGKTVANSTTSNYQPSKTPTAHVDENLVNVMASVQGDMPCNFPAPNNTTTFNYRPAWQPVQNTRAINESASTVTSSEISREHSDLLNQNTAQPLELTSISAFRPPNASQVPVSGTSCFSSCNWQANYDNQMNNILEGSFYVNEILDNMNVPDFSVLYPESANNEPAADQASLPQQTLQICNRCGFAEFQETCSWCEGNIKTSTREPM